MRTSVVMTVIGPDRPGLVESLSEVVAGHGANWVDARMAHLAGQFAGILRVDVDDEQVGPLVEALEALGSSGLRATVAPGTSTSTPAGAQTARLEIVGNDRPGIVRSISRALTSHGVNVEQLATECSSAPMAGGTLFRAEATLQVPDPTVLDALRADLERIAADLMVEMILERSGDR